MKTTKLLVMAGSIAMLSSCATEFGIVSDDVPAAVSNAFKAKYPNVSASEWEVEKEDGRLIYEAEFKLDGKRKEAEFKPDGTFIKEE
jgi:hypothetical protein